MDENFVTEKIKEYFRTHLGIFTAKDFQQFLKKYKLKITQDEAAEFLHSADYIFPLVDNKFITYATAFTGRWFSFKPTEEEVNAGAFVIGHRFMPFYDPGAKPYNATLILNDQVVPSSVIELSMNSAMDLFALFGEGYTLPSILDDPACNRISYTEARYGLPTKTSLTGFSLEPYFQQGFEYGDRILCRILDWNQCIVETKIKKERHKTLKFSMDDIEQSEWYGQFEDLMLKQIEKNGPCASIEKQLATLILEEQQTLCNENCGSIEEFLTHCSKIDISSYGLETRIWHSKEEVPFIGNWNRELIRANPYETLSLLSSEVIINSYIKDMLFRNKDCDASELFKEIYPDSMNFTDFEENFILLHLKKRIDIVESEYNRFIDHPIGRIRHSVLILFKKVMALVNSVSSFGVQLEEFPQSELVVLSQLVDHCATYLGEFENIPSQLEGELDDMNTSLTCLADTFEAIEDTLRSAVRLHKKNNS